jgi:small ligand-binding sensory domain FIST
MGVRVGTRWGRAVRGLLVVLRGRGRGRVGVKAYGSVLVERIVPAVVMTTVMVMMILCL